VRWGGVMVGLGCWRVVSLLTAGCQCDASLEKHHVALVCLVDNLCHAAWTASSAESLSQGKHIQAQPGFACSKTTEKDIVMDDKSTVGIVVQVVQVVQVLTSVAKSATDGRVLVPTRLAFKNHRN
jgi:hypothetical protein